MPLTPQTIQSLRELLGHASLLPWTAYPSDGTLVTGKGRTSHLTEGATFSDGVDAALCAAVVNHLPDLLALADSTLRDAAQSGAQAEINELRRKEAADDLSGECINECRLLLTEAGLPDLPFFDDCVGNVIAHWKKAENERDDLARQLTEAKALLLCVKSQGPRPYVSWFEARDAFLNNATPPAAAGMGEAAMGHSFHMDGRLIVNADKELTCSQVMALTGVDQSFNLILQGPAGGPDALVDRWGSLEVKGKSFYSTPPATSA